MGQITHPNLRSPMAMVSPDARLHTTGSVTVLPNVVLDKVRVRGSGLVMFPKEMDRIINGNLYQAGSYIQNMPIDTSGGVFLCCGANDIHFEFTAQTDGNMIFNIYENTQVSNSGASLMISNRSRHAAVLGSVIDAAVWVDPTISTSSGTMFYSSMFLGGSGAVTKHRSASQGIGGVGADWLFEAGSCYYMEFINEAGRLLNADFDIIMHEHKH